MLLQLEADAMQQIVGGHQIDYGVCTPGGTVCKSARTGQVTVHLQDPLSNTYVDVPVTRESARELVGGRGGSCSLEGWSGDREVIGDNGWTPPLSAQVKQRTPTLC